MKCSINAVLEMLYLVGRNTSRPFHVRPIRYYKYNNTHNYGHEILLDGERDSELYFNLANATHMERPKQYQNEEFYFFFITVYWQPFAISV